MGLQIDHGDKHLISPGAATNDCLSDSDEKLMRRLFVDLQLNLNRLETEISQTLTTLTDLLSQRERDARQLEELRIALAPHKKLPPEILADIFLHLKTSPLSMPPVIQQSQWVITQVCSRWRKVALGEHRLWNDLILDDYTFAQRAPDRFRWTVNDMFLMSFPSLISFRIPPHEVDHLDRSYNIALPFMNLITDHILPHAPRFKSLSLSLPSTMFCPLLASPSGSFRSLESLSLGFMLDPSPYLPSTYAAELLYADTETFAFTHNLRKVEVVALDGYARLTPSMFCVPWMRITDVRFLKTMVSPNMALEMLSQCTGLVSCALGLGSDSSAFRQNTPQRNISLPNLQLIALDVEFSTQLGQFLKGLTLPSLKEVCLACTPAGKGKRAWPQDDFLTMINRSRCSLDKFTSEIIIPPRQLAPLLKEMPSLSTLMLAEKDPMPKSVLKAMVCGKTLLKLESIRCLVSSADAFADLLEARWSPISTKSEYSGILTAVIDFDSNKIRSHEWSRLMTLRSRMQNEGREMVFTIVKQLG